MSLMAPLGTAAGGGLRLLANRIGQISLFRGLAAGRFTRARRAATLSRKKVYRGRCQHPDLHFRFSGTLPT